MIIMECFDSEEAHATHLTTAHFQAMWAVWERLGRGGNFEDVWSDTGKPSAMSLE